MDPQGDDYRVERGEVEEPESAAAQGLPDDRGDEAGSFEERPESDSSGTDALGDDEPEGAEAGAAESDRREPAADVDDDASNNPLGFGDFVEMFGNQILGRYVNVTGHKENVTENFNEFHLGREDRLTVEMFQRLRAEDLEGSLTAVEVDEELMTDGVERLRQHRVLCLAGMPEVGKGTFASKLAWELTRQEQSLTKVFHYQELERDVGFQFGFFVESLRKNAEEGVAVLLEDALDGRNSDLESWLRSLNDGTLTGVRSELRDLNCYVLLTSDTELWNPFLEALERMGILLSVPVPEFEGLRQVILHEIDRGYRGSERRERRARGRQLLDAERDRVRNILRTFPRARRFARAFLGILEEQGEPAQEAALAAALDHFDDVASELATLLSQDLEAGCSLLALAVTQLEPGERGVHWDVYELWRRELSERVRKRLRCEEEVRSVSSLLAPYVRDLGIEVVPGPGTTGDLVRFQDKSQSERIWRTFRSSGRGIASLLIPELEELAQSANGELRTRAARALGKLGVASPQTLVMSRISTWMEEDDARFHQALAHLIRGTGTSGDPGYVSACLAQLQAVLHRSPSRAKALAFGQSLRELGMVDVELAMECLAAVLRRGSLHQKLDGMVKVNRLNSDVRELMAEQNLPLNLAIVLVLSSWFSGSEVHILHAVRYPLVGLCFSLGPVECLSRVMPCLEDEDRVVARLLTVLLLGPDGLLDFLHEWQSRVPVEDRSRSVPIPFLFIDTVFTDQGPERLAMVFDRLFEVAGDFPNPLRNYLRRRPLEFVRGWCGKLEDWKEVPRVETPLKTILLHFLHSRHPELQEQTFQMLQHEEPFRRTGSALESLSHEVLSCPPPDRATAVTVRDEPPRV